MKVECFDDDAIIPASVDLLPVRLFAQSPDDHWACVGKPVADRIRIERLNCPPAAKDFLRLSMGVIAADRAVLRDRSQNGWTRRIKIRVPMEEPNRWEDKKLAVQRLMNFLSGDIWEFSFKQHSFHLGREDDRWKSTPGDQVSLLSGGADSLVGALDLASQGADWIAVSQTSSETELQRHMAELGKAAKHFAWTHAVSVPERAEGSERARSIGFFGFAIIAATSTKAYHAGRRIPIHGSENGLISLNPPLTPARIGTASTRTTHPGFIQQLQSLLDSLEVNVELKNTYQYVTKGEMFAACKRPADLRSVLSDSMSCGKGKRLNGHCGRCVPCIIRRAAFKTADIQDHTSYKFGPNSNLLGFLESDDVRSAYVGSSHHADSQWIQTAILPSLAGVDYIDQSKLLDVARRGLQEVHGFLKEIVE